MNLVLTRSNERQLNGDWLPFATSTPLKVVSNNVNTEKELQKRFKICAESPDIIRKLQGGCSSANITAENPIDCKHSVTKRQRKNKSCANFYFSSSSDEDNVTERKRPVIKLNFKKQTDSLLKNKKSNSVEIKDVKNTTTDNNQTTRTKKNYDKSLKQGYSQTINVKKEKKNEAGSVCSDEENQIFDKVKDSSSSKDDNKLSSEKKDNKEKFHRSDENVKNMNNCKLKTKKSEKATKSKPKTQSCIMSNPQTLKSFQELDFENEIIEKKFKNIEHNVSSTKMPRSKKSENKLRKSCLNNTRSSAVNQILENKTNISHQLFSDSKEQELLNVLDLTSGEVIEAIDNKARFLLQNKNKLISSLLTSPHPSNESNLSVNKRETKPKRKQNFNKCQLSKNLSNNHSPAVNSIKHYELKKNVKILEEHMQESESFKKCEEMNTLCTNFTENNSKKSDLSFKNKKKIAKKKVGTKISKKKETSVFNNVLDRVDSAKLSNVDDIDVKSSLDSDESVITNQKIIPPLQAEKDKKTTRTKKPVFKLLNELSYKDSEAGCSAVECWDVNAFKCGVFKLKINSQMNCKTMHANSHLGGVLIEGNIRMKIGSKELVLNPGDMAFVPPLTEWQATNIGKCESVFYYWCGRFKI